MSDQLVVQGDMIKINPTFGPMIVNAPPVPMQMTVLPNIAGKAICVLGDERLPQIVGTYIKGAFTTPGVGTARVMGLAPNQPQPWLVVGGKPALCKGAQFQVLFLPTVPAVNPVNGVPDVPAPAMGTGVFIATEVGVVAG
ncbi:hypothetical protein [Burkholderia ambifaria]|uniref:PAAR repeat-containing protein n=1 Tax=Burkholderia ambifaria MEX-5 TaxID=396597 RepID=B1T4E8_9BURK|nr:hypothetical protein [Burkholderia ambifaria]EDT41546.1 conserved hypothetical protein [Burkholderia ambifaria MEX-5]